MYNGIKFTKNSEIESIAETSFCILDECGVSVEHEKLAKLICKYNPTNIRFSGNRIYVKAGFARDYFNSFCGAGMSSNHPRISAAAEIYNGPYLDPYDGTFKEWTQERLLAYIKLAKNLPHIESASMLGCPISGIPPRQIPLMEKLYSFKYGMANPSSIWDTSLCRAIYEIWEIYANERGANISDVFCGTVYLVSPLKMGHIESEQILWFRDRGLKVGVGNMPTLGLSAPISPAGGIALNIAEQLFLSIMRAALHGDKYFCLTCGISVLDMRTCAFQYGRPERLLMNNAITDIARYYNIPCWTSGGLSDAKVPSYEAGAQKISAAIMNMMKGQNGYIAAGLLSVDEVHSPAQMVLDNEASGYLKRIFQGFAVEKSDLALETTRECAEKNALFVEQPHTAENARNCIWEPAVFSRETFGSWNGKNDYDRAREAAIAIMEGPALKSQISEECENRILKIIDNCK